MRNSEKTTGINAIANRIATLVSIVVGIPTSDLFDQFRVTFDPDLVDVLLQC